MRVILKSRKRNYIAKVSVFLIAIALIMVMVGCNGTTTAKYNLTMTANPVGGGTATDLTNASPYAAGNHVSIKAVANPGYQFVSWTAPAGGFTNANAATTNFTMPAQNVTVTANFAVIPTGPLDHFKCYLASDISGEPVDEVVYLEDQFGAVNATVWYAQGFGNPVEKWHDGLTPISNPDHHLTIYDISYEEEPGTWVVEVENQFGTQNLTVSGPVALVVPTQKVVPGQHQPPVGLDHFLLYDVIDGASVDVTVSLKDEFDTAPQESGVGMPVYFANPVQKTHGNTVTEITNPDAHLVFYYIDADFEGEVEVVNQFGEQAFDVYTMFGTGALAVPSEKIAVYTPTSLIGDWYDLDAIRDNLGGSYVLMNDLDSSTAGYTELASPTANGGKGWQPIGALGNGFTGSFDGQGYEIRDLFINRPDEDGVGLFGAVVGGVIENVGVMDADVTGSAGVGGLVGGMNGGSMGNCHATGTVTGGIGGNWTGGLVGGMNNGSVINYCYATGTVTGDMGVGGLVGGSWQSTVSDSYATGSVTGNSIVGGLVGVTGWHVSNSYATGSVTGDDNVGGLVGLNGGSVSNSFWDTETSGQATSAGGTGKTTAEMQDIATFSGAGWDIIAVANSGTRNPSYIWNIVDDVTYPFLSWQPVLLIWDWYDLDAVRDNLGGSYVLMNDLDSTTAGYEELASPTANGGKGWQPIGSIEDDEPVDPFTGTFDGQGYEIRDLFINRPDEDGVGLFGAVDLGGVIENVGVVNADVTGLWWVGGLVAYNEGDVSYSYATGSVDGSEGSFDVGGLVGWNGGDVSNCYATCAVTGGAGGNWTGGLAGAVGGTYEDTNYYGSVSYCSATGTVAGNSGVGGLVGVVGGLGDTGSFVSDSYATGGVTGSIYVGGLAGLNYYATVDSSHATGDVTGSIYVGGLAGLNYYATVSNCHYTTGTVTGTYGVGGLVGAGDHGTVSDSYATGSVIGTGTSGSRSVGGLVGGMNGGSVSNCYATGTVSSGIGGNYTGGLVGNLGGTVSDSYATGSVTGDIMVGGLVGSNYYGTVSDSYSTGSVDGSTYVGGLVGDNWGSTVSDSYSTGSVTGSTYVGGLMGVNWGTVSNSFWDTETSGQAGSAGGTGKTTAEMQDIDTFTDAGWDIVLIGDYVDETWYIADGNDYPRLGWQLVLIGDWYDLDAVRDDLGNSYLLMNDLDSTTAGYEELASPTANGGKGWQPIGALGNGFTGSFDGQGYEIRDLFINRPDEDGVGLFGAVDLGGIITNVEVLNADVTGNIEVGGLVGENDGDVSNSYVDGDVTGNWSVGGLVGWNKYGTVDNCHALGSVDGIEGGVDVGGLVGWNVGTVSNSYATVTVTGGTGGNWTGGLVGGMGGTYEGIDYTGSVSNCYATGTVAGGTGSYCVGGLVGAAGGAVDTGTTVSNSYATGTVTGGIGGNSTGGLVGGMEWTTVSDSYATGSVTGDNCTGGLVGGWTYGTASNCYATGSVTGRTGSHYVGGLVGGEKYGTVSNCYYATGTVTGESGVGGLVGINYYGTVSDSYSTGSVTGSTYVGGLVGINYYGTVSDSFWDTETSGKGTSDGGTGKTTAQMQDIDTFSGAGWDIVAVANSGTRNPSYIWNIVDDVTYPFLSWQPV